MPWNAGSKLKEAGAPPPPHMTTAVYINGFRWSGSVGSLEGPLKRHWPQENGYSCWSQASVFTTMEIFEDIDIIWTWPLTFKAIMLFENEIHQQLWYRCWSQACILTENWVIRILSCKTTCEHMVPEPFPYAHFGKNNCLYNLQQLFRHTTVKKTLNSVDRKCYYSFKGWFWENAQNVSPFQLIFY